MQHVGAMMTIRQQKAQINTKEGRTASVDKWIHNDWCGRFRFKKLLLNNSREICSWSLWILYVWSPAIRKRKLSSCRHDNKDSTKEVAEVCYNIQVVPLLPCFFDKYSWFSMPCICLCTVFQCRSCHSSNKVRSSGNNVVDIKTIR